MSDSPAVEEKAPPQRRVAYNNVDVEIGDDGKGEAKRSLVQSRSEGSEGDYMRWWRNRKQLLDDLKVMWVTLLFMSMTLIIESLNRASGDALVILIILHSFVAMFCLLAIVMCFFKDFVHEGLGLPLLATAAAVSAAGLFVAYDIVTFSTNPVPLCSMVFIWWLSVGFSTPMLATTTFVGIQFINILIVLVVTIYAFATSGTITTVVAYSVLTNVLWPLCAAYIIGLGTSYTSELLRKNTYLLSMLIAARQHAQVKISEKNLEMEMEAEGEGEDEDDNHAHAQNQNQSGRQLSHSVSVHRNFEDEAESESVAAVVHIETKGVPHSNSNSKYHDDVTQTELKEVIKNTTGWAGRYDDMGPFVLDQPRHRLSPYTLRFINTPDLESHFATDITTKPISRTRLSGGVIVLLGQVLTALLIDMFLVKDSQLAFVFIGVRLGVTVLIVGCSLAATFLDLYLKIPGGLETLSLLISVVDIVLSIVLHALLPVKLPIYDAIIIRSFMIAFSSFRIIFYKLGVLVSIGIVLYCAVLPAALSYAYPTTWYFPVFVFLVGLYHSRMIEKYHRQRLILVRWVWSLGHSLESA